MSRHVPALLLSILLVTPLFAAEPYWGGARSANWSDPANWTPARVPAATEAIEFTGWGRPTVNFDLPAGTSVGPLTFLGEYTLGGNRINLTGNLAFVSSPSAVPFVCNADLTLGASVRFLQSLSSNYNGTIDVNGKTLTIDTYSTIVHGPIVGNGTILVNGLGLSILGSGSFSGTIDGRLNVIGSYPNATVISDRLSGSGTLGVVNAALLSPGDWPPHLNGDNRTAGTLQTGALSITRLYSVDLGGSSDQVRVNGTVSVGATLEVVTHGAIAPGQSFTIIANDGTDPVSGTFAGLPEGATFTAGSTTFRITYAGGDGNDVVLNASGIATNTTLAQNRETTNLHQPVTFTATVSASSGVPSGSVTFFDGEQAIGSATLQNGVANFTTTSLSAGAHSITASFPGGNGFDASSSAPVTHTVIKHNPHVTVTSSPSLVAYGDSTTFNVTVSAEAAVTDVPSGSVALSVDGASAGTAALSATGTAEIIVPILAAGTHAIGVSYAGDAAFNAATAAMTQNVAKAATSISLVSPVNPSQAGAAVALNVRVIAPAHPTLSIDGVVRITISASTVAQAQLVNGAATLHIDSLAAGDHQLQAVYAGSDNFDSSSSATLTQHVTANELPATTTTLTQNRDSSNLHQPVTFTATVSSPNGVPTGTVTFFADEVTIESSPLQNGTASVTTKTLTPGAHNITATFAGSDAFAASSSAPLVHTVIKHNPHGTIASSPAAVAYGDSVTFSIAFEAAAGVSDTPVGIVTLTIDGSPAGTATLSSSGTATITIPMLAADTHTIRAAYDGDNNFNAATASMTLNVDRAATLVVLKPSTITASDSALAFTVRVTAPAHPALPIDGTVSLVTGGSVVAQAQLVNGAATLRAESLSAGDHEFKAVYAGNANFAGASSTPLTQQVGHPVLSIVTQPIVEGNAPHDEAIRVELSAESTQLVTVDYRTVDGTATAGSDYVAAQGTVAFLPGQTSATVPLRIIGDGDIEPEETLSLELTNAIGATIATPQTTIEISNDDLSYRAAAAWTYATIDGIALRATVFAPVAADGPRPVILWIAGDNAYDANDDSLAALRQTARGYTVVRLSYRSPAVAPFPAQIHDLQTAVRWLRTNASTLNLDGNRFIAWGTGAGGHLAALLGTGMGTSDDDASRVQAVIDWSGIAEPSALDRDALACSTMQWNAATSPVSQLIGCSVADCPASAEAAAPARYAGAGDAAMLLMHGSADCFVSPMQSERLYDSLTRAGVDATLRVYDSVGHGGAFWTSAAAYADIDAFLDRTIQRRRSAAH
jgi:acetyl esterase/lipase